MGDKKNLSEAKVIVSFKDKDTKAYCLVGEIIERSSNRIKELKDKGFVIPLSSPKNLRKSSRK